MRKTSEEFNSDTVIENIWELCGEEQTVGELSYWETVNRYLDNIPFMKERGEQRMCDLLDEMVEKGMREGITEGIKVLIVTCQELGVSFEETAYKVKHRFHLTEKETKKNMQLYW